MSAEEYWFGKPWLAQYYYRAEKHRLERVNFDAWLNGAYTARALSATVGNMFIKDKSDAIEYPTEPIPLFGEREKTPEEKVEEEDREALFAKAWMAQMMQVGKNWGKREEDSNAVC